MSKVCPPTHYDFVTRYRPDFVRAVKEYAQVRGLSESPNGCVRILNGDQDVEAARRIFHDEMVRYGRENLSRQGYAVGIMDDSQILANIPAKVRVDYGNIIEMEYPLLLVFEEFGCKTFHFGDSLYDKLSDTEMNVDAGFLHLPFPSCMFAFNNQHARDDIHAVTKSNPGTAGLVSVYLTMFNHPETQRRTLHIHASHIQDNQIIATIKRVLDVEPGQPLEESLRTQWDDQEMVEQYGHKSIPSRAFYEEGLRFIRSVINGILYLGSSNPDVIPGLRDPSSRIGLSRDEIRKIDKQLRHATRLPYISVGTNSQPYDRNESKDGKRLESLVKVRGHHRTYHHGTGRKLTKSLWIEPFWRGPDMAQVVSKPYVVD